MPLPICRGRALRETSGPWTHHHAVLNLNIESILTTRLSSRLCRGFGEFLSDIFFTDKVLIIDGAPDLNGFHGESLMIPSAAVLGLMREWHPSPRCPWAWQNNPAQAHPASFTRLYNAPSTTYESSWSVQHFRFNLSDFCPLEQSQSIPFPAAAHTHPPSLCFSPFPKDGIMLTSMLFQFDMKHLT